MGIVPTSVVLQEISTIIYLRPVALDHDRSHTPNCRNLLTDSRKSGDLDITINRPKCSIVSDSSPTDSSNGPEVTVRVFNDVMSGRGTPEQREIVLNALKDPHSPLHDWLEASGAWAEKVFRRKSASSQAAEAVLKDAISRNDRNDVVAYLRRKNVEGVINEENLLEILASGAIGSEDDSRSGTVYLQSTQNMLRSLRQHYPDLADELQRLVLQNEHKGRR
jgi:hypothetical protein